jgi:hypothetical protein
VEEPAGNFHLGDQGVDGRKIIKCNFRKWVVEELARKKF